MDTNENVILDKLELSLNTPLPKSVRKKLLDRGIVHDYLNGVDSWNSVLDQTATELAYAREIHAELSGLPDARKSSGRRRTYKVGDFDKLTPWEDARAGAFSTYLAESAKKQPEVQRFRKEVLRDSWPLTAEQVDAFGMSPALAHLPRRWFEDRGASFVEHWSYIKEHRPLRLSASVVRGFPTDHDAAGEEKARLEAARYSKEDDGYIDLFIHFNRGRFQEIEQVTICSVGPSQLFDYPFSYRAHRLRVWPGSPLYMLHGVCQTLSSSVQWWEELEAAKFILTGQMPFVFPLKAEVRRFQRQSIPHTDNPYLENIRLEEAARPNTATITIKAEPWVQEERIKKHYRRVQKELIGNNRDSWERNLRVYKFVKARRSEGIGDSEILSLWNAENPKKWRYAKRHGFWQAYKLARRSIEEVTFKEPYW